MMNPSVFGERLSELMLEQKIGSAELSKKLQVNPSTVRDWRRGKYLIFLKNLVALANCLNCSVDFLAGRSETVLDFTPHECPPFYERLREVMKERSITRYRLVKETDFSDNSFTLWKKGAEPHILTLERLAVYLDISIDTLIGRDR